MKIKLQVQIRLKKYKSLQNYKNSFTPIKVLNFEYLVSTKFMSSRLWKIA